ncbi:MAG: hypothetical protein JWQ71_1722 [Pedosphaera sp.]|nr:hypothetical protein [Pedosphaera sp.]
MKKDFFGSWRANFFTGLAIVLPAVISIAAISWLFFTISNITDTLLIFIPWQITHEATSAGPGTGPMYWYWKLVALILAILLIAGVGRLARNYLGKKMIEWVDTWLLRVPLLNKLYGATKQVNEAFTSGSKDSFKTVVMVEFPRAGMYSVGFLTSEQHDEIETKTKEKMVSVFIPTTPNPTSGFLVLVPLDQVTKLDMSVADGIKFIISLGAITPDPLALSAKKTGANQL